MAITSSYPIVEPALSDTLVGTKFVENMSPTTNSFNIGELASLIAGTINISPITIGTANGLSLSGTVLSLGLSSASGAGALSAADWSIFNAKPNASDVVTLAGTQTITGSKTFVAAGSVWNINSINQGTAIGIYSNNISTGIGIVSRNNSTGKGIQSDNNSGGDGIYSYNASGGNGIWSENTAGGNGIVSSNTSYGNGIYSYNSSEGTGILAGNNSTGDGINVLNTGTGRGIYSQNTQTGTGIFSNNTAGGVGIYSWNTSTGFGIYSNNSSTNYGIYSNNTSTGIGIYSGNSSSGNGIDCRNSSTGKAFLLINSSTGFGLYSNNSSTGTALYLNNESSGKNLVLDNTTAATGMPFTVKKNGVDKLTINDNGEVTGNKFTKTGGTVDQYLMADGSASAPSYAQMFFKAVGIVPIVFPQDNVWQPLGLVSTLSSPYKGFSLGLTDKCAFKNISGSKKTVAITINFAYNVSSFGPAPIVAIALNGNIINDSIADFFNDSYNISWSLEIENGDEISTYIKSFGQISDNRVRFYKVNIIQI